MPLEHYDKLFIDWKLCRFMLLINAAWDFLSCGSIWYSFCVKDVHSLVALSPPATDQETPPPPTVENCEQAQPLLIAPTPQPKTEEERWAKIKIGWQNRDAVCLNIAEMHTSLWSRKTDSLNHAACMLMAWWVLTLGIIRLYTAFHREFIVVAAWSYALEGMFFLAEAFKSTMTPKKTTYASIFCFVCLLVCVVEIP
jgi:hypothetical protein